MCADCCSRIPGNSSMELSINDSYKLVDPSKEGFLTNAEVLNNNESLAVTYGHEFRNWELLVFISYLLICLLR